MALLTQKSHTKCAKYIFIRIHGPGNKASNPVVKGLWCFHNSFSIRCFSIMFHVTRNIIFFIFWSFFVFLEGSGFAQQCAKADQLRPKSTYNEGEKVLIKNRSGGKNSNHIRSRKRFSTLVWMTAMVVLSAKKKQKKTTRSAFLLAHQRHCEAHLRSLANGRAYLPPTKHGFLAGDSCQVALK